MDEPYKYLGSQHRFLRFSPGEVISKYGLLDEALSWLLHIYADRSSEIKNI